MEEVRARLRELPSVDEVLRRPGVEALLADAPRPTVVEAVRQVIESRRRLIVGGERASSASVEDREVAAALAELLRPALRRVLNATGVVVHTNLGRAPLAARAVERIAEIALGYSNLEYDLEQGARGSRHDHIRRLAAAVFGAEDSAVVNNNAGAVLIVLTALAAGREVVVSRAELVEIGGGFRIPDVIVQGGATLREVGTTNRTRLPDYESAIGAATGALLKVHQSNFALVGFTEDVSMTRLAELARQQGIPLVVDLGSGAMTESYGPGLDGEPTVERAVASGADIVCFSGDKLLGGPQAGIILGRADLVERVRRHPLMRALRPSKLELAALEATLELWRDGRRDEIPVARMLAQDPGAARRRAGRLARRVARSLGCDVRVRAVEGRAGGGALPLGAAPGFALSVALPGVSPEDLERALRRGQPAIVARIGEGEVLLDLRTVSPSEERALLSGLEAARAALGQR